MESYQVLFDPIISNPKIILQCRCCCLKDFLPALGIVGFISWLIMQIGRVASKASMKMEKLPNEKDMGPELKCSPELVNM